MNRAMESRVAGITSTVFTSSETEGSWSKMSLQTPPASQTGIMAREETTTATKAKNQSFTLWRSQCSHQWRNLNITWILGRGIQTWTTHGALTEKRPRKKA